MYEQLNFFLYQDDAVTGEATGLAMCLTELASKSAQAIEDMVAYAQVRNYQTYGKSLV